jgi:hypothetical protein
METPKKRFEQQKATGGRLVQAWDTVFRRTVALKQLPLGVSAVGNGAPLVLAWERWYLAPHPGLLKPLHLDFEGKQLVREWAPGFSLLDLLRHRRRLDAEEAAALLEAAAPTLDHAAAHGLLAEAALDKWFAEFEEGPGVRPIPPLSEPLERWPAWRTRLDPLRFSRLVSNGDDCTRQIWNQEVHGVHPAVASGVHFVHELLGGTPQRRDAPLAALSDDGNRVLLAARRPGTFASATALAAALLATLPNRLPAPAPRQPTPAREYDVLDAPGAPPTRGETLLLEPLTPGSRPLRLLHRDEIRLGRSSSSSDIALRFADPSPDAEEMAKGLSRIHARLRRQGSELRLLDGPSSNGTFTREGPLTDPAGLPLRQLTLVQFGAHWRATLAPVALPAETVCFRDERTVPYQPEAEAVAEAAPATGQWGAVFIMPSAECSVRVETVWLLEEAGFGLEVDRSLAWDWECLDSAPAAFRVSNGLFYLLNRRLGAEELCVDMRGVRQGCACPLREGMLLDAGENRWRIRIA